MAATAILPLLLAVSQIALSGGGRLPDYRIIGSIDGAPPVARHAYDLRQGERLVLSIASEGRAFVILDTGESPDGGSGPGAGPGTKGLSGISWFLFKPVIKEYSNLRAKGRLDFGGVHLDSVEYIKVPLPALDNERAADIDEMIPADALGTFYIGAVEAEGWGADPMRAPVLAEAVPLHLKYPLRIVQVSRRVDDTYIGRLTELFQTPFIAAPEVTAGWVHETDERVGSDCAAFAIYGKRRQGFRVPYCGPLGIYRFLDEIAESQIWHEPRGSTEVYIDGNGSQVRVCSGGLEPGDIIHFGEQVSVFYADAGVPGVLDKDDLLIQCSLGGPEIKSIEDSGFFHKPARIFKWKRDIPLKRVIIPAEVAALTPLSLLTSPPAPAQDKWKGSMVKEGDVTIIKNPKEPIYKTPILELKEELSIGGPGAAGQAVFARMGEFIVDDAGHFYISDRKEAHIKVFDKEGRYLRTIGRRGQGPGDLDGIGALSIVRTTGELAVGNVLRDCLTFFKAEGTYLRDLPYGGRHTDFAILDSKGNIFGLEVYDVTGTTRSEVRMVVRDPKSEHPVILNQTPGADRAQFELFMPHSVWRLDPSDNLVYGYSKDYEIRIYEAGTYRLVKKVRKSYDPVPVSDLEKERYRPKGFGDRRIVMAEHHSSFRSFFLSDTGHLFVETFEEAGTGLYVHDIFDMDGRLLARMPLRPRGLKVSGGKYYALEEDDEGYQYVKRYAVTWKVE